MNLRAAFATFDADGSGFLDAEELKGLFRELGLPDHDGDDFLRVVEQGFKDQKKDLSEAISSPRNARKCSRRSPKQTLVSITPKPPKGPKTPSDARNIAPKTH